MVEILELIMLNYRRDGFEAYCGYIGSKDGLLRDESQRLYTILLADRILKNLRCDIHISVVYSLIQLVAVSCAYL